MVEILTAAFTNPCLCLSLALLPYCTRLKPVNALTLKLLGVLCWPCISAAAVARNLHDTTSHTSATAATSSSYFLPSFSSITLQVAVGVASIVLLLTAAGCAVRFGWGVVKAEADAGAVMDWGLQVGVICGCQLLLNLTQFGIATANGAMRPEAAGEARRG
jgi:hypothetical protein